MGSDRSTRQVSQRKRQWLASLVIGILRGAQTCSNRGSGGQMKCCGPGRQMDSKTWAAKDKSVCKTKYYSRWRDWTSLLLVRSHKREDSAYQSRCQVEYGYVK